LTASDGAFSSSDDLVIAVISPNPNSPNSNTAPQVNAGPDKSVTYPSGTNLTGTVADDGLPAGSKVCSIWTFVNGPGFVVFANALSPSTTATFSAAGVYTLRLTASDSAFTVFDDVVVTVNASAANKAPVVNAGADQTISLPSGIGLFGSVT